MTPHSILDSLNDAARIGADRLRDSLDLAAWPAAVGGLRKAVHFDAGDVRPTEEYEDFGFELFERARFRMPFPATLWTLAGKKNAYLVLEDDPVSLRPTDEHAGGDRGLSVVVFGEMINKESGKAWAVPLLVSRMSWAPMSVEGPTIFGWRGLSQGAAFRSTGQAWDAADYEAASDKAMRLVVGLTVMLMGRDVGTRVEPAPSKLNKKRALTGKTPITARHVITVKPHAAAYLRGPDAGAAFDGRTIRPHLRRGHFRTYHRGTEKEFVDDVAPSIVGVSAEAREAFAKGEQPVAAKTYKIA